MDEFGFNFRFDIPHSTGSSDFGGNTINYYLLNDIRIENQRITGTKSKCLSNITYDIFGSPNIQDSRIILYKLGDITFDIEDSSTYYVDLNSPGNGSISVNNTTVSIFPARLIYNKNIEVTLIALPDTGYKLSNWGGDLSGSASPAKFILNSNKNITATFIKENAGSVTYNLTISIIQGSGSFTVGTSIYKKYNQSFTFGSVLTLSAIPDSGYTFSNWSGSISSVQPSIQVTMNTNKNIYLSFVEQSEEERGGIAWQVVSGSYDGTAAPLSGAGKNIIVTFSIPYTPKMTYNIGIADMLFKFVNELAEYTAYIETESITYSESTDTNYYTKTIFSIKTMDKNVYVYSYKESLSFIGIATPRKTIKITYANIGFNNYNGDIYLLTGEYMNIPPNIQEEPKDQNVIARIYTTSTNYSFDNSVVISDSNGKNKVQVQGTDFSYELGPAGV